MLFLMNQPFLNEGNVVSVVIQLPKCSHGFLGSFLSFSAQSLVLAGHDRVMTPFY